MEPSLPPPETKHQPHMPSCGAANAAGCRTGGSWRVPLAVSRLASLIHCCTSSPKQAAVWWRVPPPLKPLIITDIIVVIPQLTGTVPPACVLRPMLQTCHHSRIVHTCIPSHHVPTPICFRRRYLALIYAAIFPRVLFVSFLPSYLFRTRIHLLLFP